MPVTSGRLDDDLHQRLERLAKREQCTRGWLINDALRGYIDREELRSERYRQSLQALDEVEAGAPTADGDAVREWITPLAHRSREADAASRREVRLRYGPRALSDLQRLHAFVAWSDAVAADRTRRRLLAGFDALGEQPGLGRALEQGRSIRQWVAGEYVLHSVERGHEEVNVLRIWQGRETC